MMILANRLKMFATSRDAHNDTLYELKGEYLFNGSSSQVIDSGFHSGGHDLTIEWWGMSHVMPTISSQHAYFGEVDMSTNSYGMLFVLHSGKQYICGSYYRGNGNTQITGALDSYTINKYFHFAITKEVGGRLRLYMNGVLVSESVNSVQHYEKSTYSMKIGGNTDYTGSSSRILNGKIKNFRVLNGVLNASQILDIYNQG